MTKHVCNCKKKNDEYERILNLKIPFIKENEEITIREFFERCLISLWWNADAFKGLSPLGLYDWEYKIITVLIKEGLVEGSIDEEDIIDFDSMTADNLMINIIKYLFSGE
jgi:hypothetical protein